MYDVAELKRLLHNLIQVTTVSKTDVDKRRLKVKIGDGESAWLPWPADIGRNYTRWKPMRVGQQVVIACPSGDPAQAVLIANLYTNSFPPPTTDEAVDVIEFTDGSKIVHNANDKSLEIVAAGELTLRAKRINMRKG